MQLSPSGSHQQYTGRYTRSRAGSAKIEIAEFSPVRIKLLIVSGTPITDFLIEPVIRLR